MDNCSICLANFKDDDIVSALKCSKMHVFHTKCIKESIDKRHYFCPLCRARLDDDHISRVSSDFQIDEFNNEI